MSLESSLNEFSKKHLKALREGSYYTLIHGNVNYETYFRDATSITKIYKGFFDGINFEDGTSLKLPDEDIVGFYAFYHNTISPEDLKFLMHRLHIPSIELLNTFISNSRIRISNMKAYARNIGAKIQMDLDFMETFMPVEYTQTENSEDKYFKLYMKNGNDKGREVNETDTLDIFQALEPNIRYPVVIYSNPSGEYKYKCSIHDIVDFDAPFLIRLQLPPNSISIITKIGEVTTLDFEFKSTIIKTNYQRENDNRVEKVKIFIPMIYFDEDNGAPKKIKGKIKFEVDKVIDYYSFYTYIITDPVASTLFYINETARAWCSKDNFEIFFRDYSNEMVDGTNIKTTDSYFKFTIPTNEKENISGFTISFTIKTKDMMASFLYKFSRLLRHFMSLTISEDQPQIAIRNNKVKIYTKPSVALVGEAPEFFKHLTKERGEATKKSKGKTYKRKCQAGDQPIIIKDDEVIDWEEFGRTPIHFPPPEWGFKKQIWIVCPTDRKQVVVFHNNEQDESGRVKMLPCCNDTGVLKARTTIDTIANATGRSGITEAVSNLSSYGALNEALSRFLALSFNKDGHFIFQKQGTVFKDQKFSFLNSAIIALLAATDLQLEPGVPLSMISPVEIAKNVNIVRSLMSMLPPDIYKQELYDMIDEEIIQSILDPETYIDPYLYYRGLEIVFNVQIVVFTSNVGRTNPFSEEETDLPIASLEIPRCKYVHIRHMDSKPIVCLYKNYGSTSNPSELPACELIVCMDRQEKLFARRYDPIFVDFHKNVGDLVKRTCHPIEWERTPGVKIGDSLYDDPYSSINWGNYLYKGLGDIYGQEIDIYGKTTSLIFEEWTLIIPPTQPLPIYDYEIFDIVAADGSIKSEKKIKLKEMKIRSPDGNYHNHSVFTSGTKKRPPLKTLEEVKSFFDISYVDEDGGAWMEFNGKKRGIKIPYLTTKNITGRSMNVVYNQIARKNNLSILMQIINWLWRSEWTIEKGYPNFKNWWKDHTEIDNSIIFDKVPKPFKNCNNYMFPRHCNTYEERLYEMSKLWPFFFYHGKIHVSKELYFRIQNFFQVEDIYSSGLTPDDIYGEPGRFITKLIPTDDDFKAERSIIFTEPEHLQIWVSRNNSSIFKYSSYFNANIIKEIITSDMRKMVDYYFYSETDGDNSGQIYLVQNSAVPSQPGELSALNIAQHWKVHERNPGAFYKKDDDANFVTTQRYVIYKIGPQNTLEVAIDKSEGSTDYLQILNYDDETYAALIPLLLSNKSEENDQNIKLSNSISTTKKEEDISDLTKVMENINV